MEIASGFHFPASTRNRYEKSCSDEAGCRVKPFEKSPGKWRGPRRARKSRHPPWRSVAGFRVADGARPGANHARRGPRVWFLTTTRFLTPTYPPRPLKAFHPSESRPRRDAVVQMRHFLVWLSMVALIDRAIAAWWRSRLTNSSSNSAGKNSGCSSLRPRDPGEACSGD